MYVREQVVFLQVPMKWPKLFGGRSRKTNPRRAMVARLLRDNRALRRQRDGFKAADRDRLTADWPTAPMSISDRLRANLRSLRAVSRKQAVDNPYAKRFLQMTWNNVVGPNGFVLQSRAKTPDEDELDAL